MEEKRIDDEKMKLCEVQTKHKMDIFTIQMQQNR